MQRKRALNGGTPVVQPVEGHGHDEQVSHRLAMLRSKAQVPGGFSSRRRRAIGSMRSELPMQSLHVAYVSPAWPPELVQNGIATYVGYMRSGLAALGIASSVIARSLGAPDGPDVEVVRHEAARTFRGRLAAGLRRRLSPRHADYVQAAIDIVAAARRLRQRRAFDAIEMEESFGVAAHVLPRALAPVILRLHGPWFLTGAASGVMADEAFARRVAMEGRAILRAVAVSAPTRALLDAVQNRYGRELACAEVVPNPGPPVDPAGAWAPRRQPTQILHVGRFERLKGSDVAIDAFAQLAAERPDLELLLVGPDLGVVGDDGARRDAPAFLRDRALPAAVRQRIRLLGPQPPAAVAALRRAASVVLVPSRYENFPLALLEAMSDGCPVIASAVGGIPEIVTDGRDGVLVPAGDPGALAAALRSLLSNPEAAARMGAAARARYRTTWTPEAVAARMAAFYERVAAHCGLTMRRS